MKLDKEIPHPIHPQHNLALEYTETPFNCDGCKEPGIGLKYSCRECDFDLHKACATPSLSVTHPFYRKCEFQFHSQSPGEAMRICDGCGNDVLGFVYHCKGCGFDLHPCCANLPPVLDDGKHSLYLCLKQSGPCHHCGRRGSGWAYKTKCKGYNVHVSCVKELLVENWQAMCLNGDKDKVREMQTKIPSLKGRMKSHHGGKVKKCCEIAGGAVHLTVSAVLGDPTAIIAAVVGSFLSR